MHGPFDTNRYDLHPPGTKLVTLDDPSERKSFAPHGVPAFYIGIAPNHYRSYRVYVPSTNKIRVTNSVAWIPSTPVVPKYPTLPPGLFANQPTPVQKTTPTYSSTSEGAALLLPVPDDIAIIPTPLAITSCETPPPSPATITYVHPTPPIAISNPIHRSDLSTSEGANFAFFVHYEKAIKGPNYETWRTSMDTEMRRLITKTKSMALKSDGIVPANARVATANPVPISKTDPLDPTRIIEYRTRLTWGRVHHPTSHPTTSSTIDTTAVKLLLNSAISDPHAILSTVDISDFYLNSKLDTPAYLRVPIRYLPSTTREWLGVNLLPNDSILLFEVYNAIYGMDDAGRVSQMDLMKHLEPHGYRMCRHTPGLFFHDDSPSFRFTTWVDDFLIKSDPNTTDLETFINVLKLKYPIKFEPVAKSYIGYKIDLIRNPDHALDTLSISMPGYAANGLSELNFTATSKPNSPIVYVPPIYGGAVQFVDPDESPPATSEDQAYLRRAVGIFRYYADAIDSTLSLAISRLASQQEAPNIHNDG